MLHLYHLGCYCTPGLIINGILKQTEKTLFMLGIYNIDGITAYLENDNLDEIYDLSSYTQHPSLENYIIHNKYNIQLNHDFKFKNKIVINNEKIVARFKEKVDNWRTMCASSQPVVFLHICESVNKQEILKFMHLMERKRINVYIICLALSIPENINHPHISCKQLETHKEFTINPWDAPNDTVRLDIAVEQYAKFIESLTDLNIKHDYPPMFTPDMGIGVYLKGR